MKPLNRFAKFSPILIAGLALTGCSTSNGLFGDSGRYGSNPPYYADDYYRDGSNYRERKLGNNDKIYRGRDGRYYCERSDGTTGLIVGGLAGGVLGNVIAPGGSKTLGSVLGAIGGAVAGRAIDRNNEVRCR